MTDNDNDQPGRPDEDRPGRPSDQDSPHLPGSGQERLSPVAGGGFQSPGVVHPSAVTELPPESDELSIEKSIDLEQKSYSQGQLVRRRFIRHKAAIISLIVLVGVTVLSFSALGIGPIPGWWDKSFSSTGPRFNDTRPTLQLFPPVWGEHPFGQNENGTDNFAMVMRGTQRSLTIAFTVGLLTTFIGTMIGATAGFFRGWIEAILMRLTDLFIVVPLLVLAAVLGQMSGGGLIPLAILLSLVSWTGLARLVRGEVLSLREREFVAAAEAIGTSSWRIIFRHILPNTMGVVIVSATLAIASVILLESALSFLGFGIRPPDTSLGLLINQYQEAFRTRPWLFWWPGMTILTIALSVNFLGDGLRDAFDPRQSRSAD